MCNNRKVQPNKTAMDDAVNISKDLETSGAAGTTNSKESKSALDLSIELEDEPKRWTLSTYIWHFASFLTVAVHGIALIVSFSNGLLAAAAVAVPTAANDSYNQNKLEDTDSTFQLLNRLSHRKRRIEHYLPLLLFSQKYFSFFIFCMLFRHSSALRSAQNELRDRANQFAIRNMELSRQQDRLEAKSIELREKEQNLRKLGEKMGLSTNTLRNLLKENQEINNHTQRLIRRDILLKLIQMVHRADLDNDGTLEGREVKRLVQRLRHDPTIVINEELFLRKVAECGGRVNYVLEMVNHFYDEDDIPDDERLFVIDEDAYIVPSVDRF